MSKQLTTKIDKQFLGRLCSDAISNLQKACDKHPTFPDKVSEIDLETAIRGMYRLQQINSDPNTNAFTISAEEEMEFEVAILQGMPKQAYDELVDIITVWLRVGLHLTDYVHASGVDLQPAIQTFVAPPARPLDQERSRAASVKHRAVGPHIKNSFLGPTLRGVLVTDDEGRKVMMQP